jgi:uncharacterized protein YxjI
MFRRMGMRRGAEAAPAATPMPSGAPGAAPTGAPGPAAAPTPGPGGEAGNRFKIREKLFTFGDDFYVENASGGRVYWVDGKALRVRDTLLFKDMQGNERYKIQEKIARVRDTMTLYDGAGGTAATMKKALITPLRDRYEMDVAGGGKMETKGNILSHEYTIEQNGKPVAEISKRWFRVRDTYSIDVTPGSIDPLLAIAMTVAIDMMGNPG